ncbi:glycosyltransferase [Amycolatopsis sp. NPDC004378]
MSMDTVGPAQERVVVIAPPFASHARPMAMLGAGLAAAGADVTFACAPAFAGLADEHRLRFRPFSMGGGANDGVAERTEQDAAASARLAEFFAATRDGAVAALRAQARHRRADMLTDPGRALAAVRALEAELSPEWYVTDQLAYAVTLALHCVGSRWATFCPGHPSYIIEEPGRYFGLPPYWPSAIAPDIRDLDALRKDVVANDRLFTRLFDEFVAEHAPDRPRPPRAFALTSAEAIVFSYPLLPWLPIPAAGPARIFAGHCSSVGEEELDPEWRGVVRRLTAGGRRLALVSFGTFLSARDDVLATVTDGLLAVPDLSVVLAAGDRNTTLSRRFSSADARVHVAGYLPQRTLLPHVDLVVHHGGNNSFTECLAAGLPALALPFSSDQFAVAADLERCGGGLCLNPATVTAEATAAAASELLTRGATGLEPIESVRDRGPEWAARRLLSVMRRPHESDRV